MIMSSLVQARLDPESEKIMQQLVKKTGWSTSKIVREGLRVLASCHVATGPRTIRGQGKFPSGIGDLATNKAHMRDFGR